LHFTKEVKGYKYGGLTLIHDKLPVNLKRLQWELSLLKIAMHTAEYKIDVC